MRKKKAPSPRYRKFLRSYIEALLITIAVAFLFRIFVITPYEIPLSTMAPNVLAGDSVYVFKLPYGLKIPGFQKLGEVRELKRGTVVLYSRRSDSPELIRRVIGLPGDKVEIKNREVILNNKPLSYVDSDLALIFKVEAKENVFLKEEIAPGQFYDIMYERNKDEKDLDPILLTQDEVLLLSDRREAGDGLQYWEIAKKKNINGRVLFVWRSIDPIQGRLRWDRFFKGIH